MVLCKSMENSNEQLIADYLAGKEESLEVLIGRYLKPIYAFVYQRAGQNSETAQDITQDIFVKMWKNLKKYKPANGGFKPWLFTIAKNTIIDFSRKRKTLPLSQINDIADNSSDIIDILDNKNKRQVVALALMALPAKTREIFLWRWRDNFTFQKIAEITGKSINTVKSLYRRAVFELRKKLPEF